MRRSNAMKIAGFIMVMWLGLTFSSPGTHKISNILGPSQIWARAKVNDTNDHTLCATLMGIFNWASSKLQQTLLTENHLSLCGCFQTIELAQTLDFLQCDHGPYASQVPAICFQPSPPAETIAVVLGGKTFSVELAETQVEKIDGLACREDLAEDAGMLFIYNHDVNTPFWMANTYFPLDIIFVDQDRRIINYHTGVPLSTELLYPAAPYRYVLEIPGGMAEQLNLRSGDPLQFNLP